MRDTNPLGAAESAGQEILFDLLDRLPQAVIILTADGTVRYWSSGAAAMLGYTAPEMLGLPAERLLPPELARAGETGRLFEKARAGAELRGSETQRLAQDGRELSLLLTQFPILDPAGAFQGVLQTFTDITEHKRLQWTLESRVHQLSIIKEIGEALYGTMDLEEILHLILVGVTAGPGLGFNRAFLLLAAGDKTRLCGRLAIGPSDASEAARIWGQLAQQPMTLRQMLTKYENLAETDVGLNRIVRELVVPLDDETSLLAKAIRTGTAVTLPADELSSLDRGLASKLGTAAFAIAPLSAKGRTIGALLADNAITGRAIQPDDLEMLRLLAATASIAMDNSRLYLELAHRLAALEAARADARRFQQAVVRAERLSVIGEMAATVAHDIRNPLVAIGGFARLLLDKAEPDTSQHEFLGIIVDEVMRLEGILTKVLDRARPAAPETRAVQVNRLIEEAVRLLDQEFKDSGVQATLRLDPGLPSIPADSDRLFEMILNLLRNAVQAMPGGGSLSVFSLPTSSGIELQFTDTGQGVPEEIQQRIFSPFFTTKPSGSGLGLAVVEQIVREHGGTITLHSVLGAGTTFKIGLPLKGQEAHND